MRLFSYKMTNDSGFAPNPFGCTLTLATCKPQIRRYKKEGDWIAGFTSVKLAGHEVGSERLIYLMRVAEKLPMWEYFWDSRFRDKIPHKATSATSAYSQATCFCSSVFFGGSGAPGGAGASSAALEPTMCCGAGCKSAKSTQ